MKQMIKKQENEKWRLKKIKLHFLLLCILQVIIKGQCTKSKNDFLKVCKKDVKMPVFLASWMKWYRSVAIILQYAQ